jgi:SAM-dependent methyltransferase
MKSYKCKWCNFNIVTGISQIQSKRRDRWLCSGCGAIGYIREPTVEELVKIYKKAWKDSKNIDCFAVGTTSTTIADSLISVFCGPIVRGSCLEYGGGHGKLAEALLDHYVDDIYVFEPFGSKQKISGVKWFSSWDNLPLNKKFDWIFMVEVLEHLLNPVEELSKIRRKLNPGGKLAITTPNARGWRSIIEGMNWREAQNPTHINLFSPDALKTCLRQSGFKQIQRIYKPVNFKRNKFANAILGILQILGMDGGIRVVAQDQNQLF